MRRSCAPTHPRSNRWGLRRLLTAALAVGLTAPVVAACSSGGGNTLSIMYQYATAENKVALEKMIDQYEQSHPDVTINEQGVSLNQAYTVLQTRVSAHNVPDVVFAPTAIIPSYAAQGQLADLTPYLPKDFFAAFSPARTAIDRPDNTIVGAPIADSVRAVVYNQTAFDKAGIKVPGLDDQPWMWAEMVAAAKTVQEKGGVRYGLQFEKPSFDGWLPFLFQNGGTLVGDDGKATIGNAAGVGALQWTKSLYDQKLAAPGVLEGTEDPEKLFVSGQVGLWLGAGTYDVPALQNEVTQFKYGVTYLPQNVKNTTVVGGNDVIAFKGDNEKQAADFIQYAVSPSVMTLLTNATASIAPRSDAMGVVSVRPDLVPIFAKQETYLDPTLVQQYLTGLYGKTKDQLLRELQSVVTGGESPESAADNMARILNGAQA